jgi:hypothetical protein
MGVKFEKNKILFKWALKESKSKVLVIIGFFEFAAIARLIQDGSWIIFFTASGMIFLLYIYLLLHLMYPSFTGRKNYNVKLPIRTQRRLKLKKIKKL